ncbi:RIP metalloprotease RseP [Candidatus Nitrosacidococcus tergens]|uniref:Zinc metalloprotease n=1 Tax=Candidatus Nitrosacidococcus tergens TaxID=553981 RepID=A0A7G1Q820_9GAMM|nr:RIP metalloprotease RseP [Candidatus Nitrosacidococcus tergens]CAB1274913.1 zinc metallopeptidase [Candidatus Nitrosacidococcus tergens]
MLISIVAFIIAIGVLVTVHEYGHFWIARRSGVKVIRFSIGFGYPLWRRYGSDGTEYVLGAIPLGGYVKMLDEREGEVQQKELSRAFNRQSLSIRNGIIVAGPVANILFAIVAYWFVFILGTSGIKPIIGHISTNTPAEKAGIQMNEEIIAIGKKLTPTWDIVAHALLIASQHRSEIPITLSGLNGVHELNLPLNQISSDPEKAENILNELGIIPKIPSIPPIIGKVFPDEPAAKAGFQPEDYILQANGDPIHSWSEWVQFIRNHPNTIFNVEIDRKGEHIVLGLEPKSVEEQGEVIGHIGVAPKPLGKLPEELQATLKYNPLEAIPQSLEKTWEIGAMTAMMFGKMLLGKTSTKSISGPITIARYAGYSVQIGFTSFLNFLALVSISLAVLNLLPIPVLDGGHLFYNCIEFIRGGVPLSESAQITGQQIGIIFLVVLMGLAFYNDVARLFS